MAAPPIDAALVAVNVVLNELGKIQLTVQTWTLVVWDVMKKVETYPIALTGPQKKQVVLAVLKALVDQLVDSEEKQLLQTMHANVSAQIDLMVSIANTTEKLGEVAVHSCCF